MAVSRLRAGRIAVATAITTLLIGGAAPADGAIVWRQFDAPGAVSSDINSDGSRVVTAAGSQATVYDVAVAVPTPYPIGQVQPIGAVCFSTTSTAGNSLIGIGYSDSSDRAYTEAGDPQGTYSDPAKPGSVFMQFASEAGLLISARANIVVVWELGLMKFSVDVIDTVVRMKVMPSGSELLVCTASSIATFSLADGAQVRTLWSGSGARWCDNGGNRLAIALTGTAGIIIDSSSGAAVATLTPADSICMSVAVRPDGLVVACGGSGGRITSHDAGFGFVMKTWQELGAVLADVVEMYWPTANRAFSLAGSEHVVWATDLDPTSSPPTPLPPTPAPPTPAPPTPIPPTPAPPTPVPPTPIPPTPSPPTPAPPTPAPPTPVPFTPNPPTPAPPTLSPPTPLPPTPMPPTPIPPTQMPPTPLPPTPAPPTATPPTLSPPTPAPPTPEPPTPIPPSPAPPTPLPPTPLPPTPLPPTPLPPTPLPPTPIPPTPAPPTNSPPTPFPPTPAPPTPLPLTPAPPTPLPPTPLPPTPAPPTPLPPTPIPETDAPPTPAPPTSEPPTPAPPTPAPPTPIPDTDVPPTPVPPTPAPPTSAPRTDAPATLVPETDVPPTDMPRTMPPPTPAPPTDVPRTGMPRTPAPPTGVPATGAPPTPAPPTREPTTRIPLPPPTEMAPLSAAQERDLRSDVINAGGASLTLAPVFPPYAWEVRGKEVPVVVAEGVVAPRAGEVVVRSIYGPADRPKGVVATALRNPRFLTGRVSEAGTMLTLTFKDDGFLLMTPKDETLSLTLSPTLFEPGYGMCDNGECVVTVKVHAETPKLAAQEELETEKDAAAAVMASATLVAPVGNAGPNAGVLALSTRVLLCPTSEVDELDSTLNPLGLAFGPLDDPYRDYHGAVIGALVIAGGLCIVCLIAAAWIYRNVRRVKILDVDASGQGFARPAKSIDRRFAAMRSRLGWLLMPFGFLYSGAALGAITVLVYSPTLYRVPAGVLAVTFLFGLPYYCYHSARLAHKYCEYRPAPAPKITTKLFWGSAEWVPREDRRGSYTWFALHHLVYDAYKPQYRYFMAMQLVMVFIFSGLAAYQPPTIGACWFRALTMTIIMAVATLFLLVARPYVAPYENIGEFIIHVLETAMLVCTLLAMGAENPSDHWGAEWAGTCGFAVMWALMIKFACDVVVFVMDEYDAWKTERGDDKPTGVKAFVLYLLCGVGSMSSLDHYQQLQLQENLKRGMLENDDEYYVEGPHGGDPLAMGAVELQPLAGGANAGINGRRSSVGAAPRRYSLAESEGAEYLLPTGAVPLTAAGRISPAASRYRAHSDFSGYSDVLSSLSPDVHPIGPADLGGVFHHPVPQMPSKRNGVPHKDSTAGSGAHQHPRGKNRTRSRSSRRATPTTLMRLPSGGTTPVPPAAVAAPRRSINASTGLASSVLSRERSMPSSASVLSPTNSQSFTRVPTPRHGNEGRRRADSSVLRDFMTMGLSSPR